MNCIKAECQKEKLEGPSLAVSVKRAGTISVSERFEHHGWLCKQLMLQKGAGKMVTLCV